MQVFRCYCLVFHMSLIHYGRKSNILQSFTSCTCEGFRLACLSAPLIASAPRTVAGTVESEERNDPTGVRAAPTNTTS